MLITKEIQFDMAHRLPCHQGRCKNLHGHTYKVDLIFEGDVQTKEGATDEGMLLDFQVIKSIASEYIDSTFDHATMLHKSDEKLIAVLKEMEMNVVVVNYQPTAENMAKDMYNHLAPLFEKESAGRVKLVSITLWETPTSSATYDDLIDNQPDEVET